MAKTNRKPSDKFERKQRLAQRPSRQEDDYEGLVRKDWYEAGMAEMEAEWPHSHYDLDSDDVADEISSSRTNAAY